MVLEQAFAGAIAPHSLLINLAFLLPEPTGITTYAAQIYPRLQALDPTLLIPQAKPSYRYHLVPTHMTSAQGLLGHGRRLLWTQRQLPEIYRQLGSRLLFSPLPEAPLGTNCRFVCRTGTGSGIRTLDQWSPGPPLPKSIPTPSAAIGAIQPG